MNPIGFDLPEKSIVLSLLGALVVFAIVDARPPPLPDIADAIPLSEEEMVSFLTEADWSELSEEDFQAIWEDAADYYLKRASSLRATAFLFSRLKPQSDSRIILLLEEGRSDVRLLSLLVTIAYINGFKPLSYNEPLYLANKLTVSDQVASKLKLPSAFVYAIWIGRLAPQEILDSLAAAWVKYPHNDTRPLAAALQVRHSRDSSAALSYVLKMAQTHGVTVPEKRIKSLTTSLALDYLRPAEPRPPKKISKPPYDRINEED